MGTVRLRSTLIGTCILALAVPSSQAATFSVLPDKLDGLPVIKIDGTIEPLDDRKFIRLALDIENAVVMLASDGGEVSAGLAIGRAVRLKGFSTFVPAGVSCASMCGYIWLAGSPRKLAPTSYVGFHAAYSLKDGKPVETGSGNALIGAYLNQIGLGEKAIYALTATPPEQLRWLTAADAATMGIDVEVVPVGIEHLLKKSPMQDSAPRIVLTPKQEPLKTPDTLPTVEIDPVPQPEEEPDVSPEFAPKYQDVYVIARGHDIFGHDLAAAPVPASNIKDCQQACDASLACMAFTYHREKQRCYLKAAGGKVLKNAATAAGYRPGIRTSLSWSRVRALPSIDLTGYDYRSAKGIEFVDCIDRCESDARCRAFSYVSRAKECYLKNGMQELRKAKGIMSGIKPWEWEGRWADDRRRCNLDPEQDGAADGWLIELSTERYSGYEFGCDITHIEGMTIGTKLSLKCSGEGVKYDNTVVVRTNGPVLTLSDASGSSQRLFLCPTDAAN